MVDKIIYEGKCPYDKFFELRHPDLTSLGIMVENNSYVFKETPKELGEKALELGIDIENTEEFELCYQVQMNQRRYDRMKA